MKRDTPPWTDKQTGGYLDRDKIGKLYEKFWDLAKEEFNSQVHEKILEFRETLKDNERLILDRRHLAEQTVTLQVLGDSLGVTRERARQIEARLLTKLKAYLLEAMPDVEDHVD